MVKSILIPFFFLCVCLLSILLLLSESFVNFVKKILKITPSKLEIQLIVIQSQSSLINSSQIWFRSIFLKLNLIDLN